MLSAICFNLDQSKILSSGNGLTTYASLCVLSLLLFEAHNQISREEGLFLGNILFSG